MLRFVKTSRNKKIIFKITCVRLGSIKYTHNMRLRFMMVLYSFFKILLWLSFFTTLSDHHEIYFTHE